MGKSANKWRKLPDFSPLLGPSPRLIHNHFAILIFNADASTIRHPQNWAARNESA
jgi:hypothetical protein